MKTDIDYLCKDLADAVVRWQRQADTQRREAKAYRERSNAACAEYASSFADACEAHANTLRRLILDYAPDVLAANKAAQ